MIRQPRLLDSSLNEVRRINPISFSVTETSTPLSTASIQLVRGDKIPNRAWVEMFTPNGSAGIFRVRTPSEAYGDGDNSVELEHGITELGDWLVEDEIESSMALNNAMLTLFGHYGGSHWQLGSNPFTDTITLDVDHENVLEAMLGILDQTPYMLTFDFTTTPWTLNVSQVDQNVSAEGRLSRNVLSAQVSVDDSELATRVFASYKTTVNKEQVTVWVNEQDNDAIALYGIVEAKTEDDYEDEASARAGAIKYLNKHKRPKISASINGYDFSTITGESLDRIRIGKKYRLAIEGESNPIEEVIKTISWQNLDDDEYRVTIGLSEEDDLLIKTLNSNKSAAKSSSRAKKELESLHYEFYSEDGYFRSMLDMNEYRLRTIFEDTTNSLRSEVEQTASHLRSTFEDGQNSLRSVVEQTASYWRSTYENGFNSLRTIVEQTDSGWKTALEGVVDANGNVTAASIATKINAQGQAGVKISGAWIDIDGIVSQLASEQVTVDAMTCNGTILANAIDVQHIYLDGEFEYNIYDAEVNGNTLILYRVTGNPITFSKAVASVEWSWSNGTLTVTPKPQNGNFVLGSLVAGTKSYRNGTYTVPVQFQWGSSGQYSESTFRNITVTPSVTAGTSTMSWDSTNKVLYNYGYAYLEGGSQAVATSTKRTSSTISLDTSASWSNGSKAIVVKHGSTNILNDSVAIPASSGTAWENPTGHQWRARLTIGGVYRYSDNHEFYTLSEYNTALATVPSGYTEKSATTITNGNINAASIGVYSGHYACNMNLTLNFGDGTTRSADVSGGVIVDDIVEYGKALGGGCSHKSLGQWYYTKYQLPSGLWHHQLVLEQSGNSIGGMSQSTNYTIYK